MESNSIIIADNAHFFLFDFLLFKANFFNLHLYFFSFFLFCSTFLIKMFINWSEFVSLIFLMDNIFDFIGSISFLIY